MRGAQSAGKGSEGTAALAFPQTTYVVNPTGSILYLDEKLSRMLGYSQDELLGEHYSRIVDINRSPLAGRLFNERRTGNRATSGYPLTLNSRNGNSFKFDLHSIGVYSKDHKFVCSQGTLTRARRKKHGAVINPAGLVAVALEPLLLFRAESGLLAAANHRAAEMLCADPENLVNSTLQNIFPDVDGDKLLAGIRALPEGEELSYEDVTAQRRDGRSFPCEVSFKLLPFTGRRTSQPGKTPERIRYLAAGIRDLSAVKEMETQVMKMNNLHTLGEMSCGVAHDFNNLLSAILGHVQLLITKGDKKPPTWDDVKKRLQVVERAALDGAETVSRILRFSRISGEREVELLDLNNLVRETLAITRSRWKDEAQVESVEIRVIEDYGTVRHVLGRGNELREVLTNLVFNAVDAIRESGTITVRTGMKSGRVFASVSDDGIGIPPEVREKVFQPFYTTKGKRGSGLGLSISCGIIERHEGEIMVDSEKGQGSTFTIYLPVANGKPREEAPREAPGESCNKGRILVIDDDKYIREVVSEILLSVGHQVDVAVDGIDGMALFNKHQYDLVFTDLGMPGISGWEVASRIKASDKSIPVIVMTGWGAQVEEAKVKGTGVQKVLAKPMQMRQVVSVTEETLRRARDK
jgi:PAS domain S-box-containing protein